MIFLREEIDCHWRNHLNDAQNYRLKDCIPQQIRWHWICATIRCSVRMLFVLNKCLKRFWTQKKIIFIFPWKLERVTQLFSYRIQRAAEIDFKTKYFEFIQLDKFAFDCSLEFLFLISLGLKIMDVRFLSLSGKLGREKH